MEISFNDRFYNEKIKAISVLYSIELMVNIIDLGLVYGLNFKKEGTLPEREVRVEIVWEPAWNIDMLTAEARWQLES